MQYWQKDRCIDQQNRKESPEMDPGIHLQLIFDKGAKAAQWGKEYIFNK